MPVFPINERGKIPLEDFQLGFIKNVALELFELVASIIPGKRQERKDKQTQILTEGGVQTEMQFCVSMMNENIRRWEEIKGHNPHDSGVADVPSAEENDDDLLRTEKEEEIRPYDLIRKLFIWWKYLRKSPAHSKLKLDPEENERRESKHNQQLQQQENGSLGNEREHPQENHQQSQQKQQQEEPGSSPQAPHYTSHPAPRLSLSEDSPPMLAGYEPPTANPSSGDGLATGCHCIIQ